MYQNKKVNNKFKNQQSNKNVEIKSNFSINDIMKKKSRSIISITMLLIINQPIKIT